METRFQSDDPRADKLAKRGAERLAAFILKLGQNVDGVDARIETFLASDDCAGAVRLAARCMAEVKSSRTFYHGLDGAQKLLDQLGNVLDIIETAVLPANPPAAFDLMARFMDCDENAFERANDSDGILGEVFRRACELFADVARHLPSADTLPVLKRLIAADGYGARGDLLRFVGRFLDQPHLAALIAELRAGLAGGEESARGARWQLAAVAESVRDPVLYEEAIQSSVEPLPTHLIHDIARHYLDAGRPRDALARLPPDGEGPGGLGCDYHDIRIRALRAIGDQEAIRPALWSQFLTLPIRETLEELLEAEPAETRATRREAALKQARARLDPQSLAEFLAEIGEIDAAAGVVLDAPNRLDGDRYSDLVPLAEKLEDKHPLAATFVYRALLDSILQRGHSKSYHHGGRYWVRLLELGARVDDWRAFETELEYRERIGREHPRKTAFWKAANEAMGHG